MPGIWKESLRRLNELASVVDADDEASSSHVPDVVGSLFHLSLADGNLIQVQDNSLS